MAPGAAHVSVWKLVVVVLCESFILISAHDLPNPGGGSDSGNGYMRPCPSPGRWERRIKYVTNSSACGHTVNQRMEFSVCVQSSDTYYTQWFNTGGPDSNGDFERLPDIRNRYGQSCICRGKDEVVLTQCRVRGSTTLYPFTSPCQDIDCNADGLSCRNVDNPAGCLDYEIRFLCARRYDSMWFNVDTPDGVGDVETKQAHEDRYGEGMTCSRDHMVVGANCRQANLGQHHVIIWPPPQTLKPGYECSKKGLVCLNADNRQRDCVNSAACYDYEVQYQCAAATQYYTQWMNRDSPSGTSDNESLTGHRETYGNNAICNGCDLVIGAECRVRNGDGTLTKDMTDPQVYQPGFPCTTAGLVCNNADQPFGAPRCRDYEVRYICLVQTTP